MGEDLESIIISGKKKHGDTLQVVLIGKLVNDMVDLLLLVESRLAPFEKFCEHTEVSAHRQPSFPLRQECNVYLPEFNSAFSAD